MSDKQIEATIIAVVILVGASFWGTVFYVAAHFIAKFW